jgi:hypothetical protein
MSDQKSPVNFLYLGGDKCGSTWIWHILNQHPDVALATAKEIFYFDRFYDKGPDWYRRQFPDKTNAIRIGEICHDYLYSEVALQRIAQDLPQDSRFLVTVRDPVSRSVSHWKYLRKIGRTTASFEDALHQQPQIIEHSLFGKHVQNAMRHLGKDRVHVLDFGQLKTDPQGFGRAMSAALGIRFMDTLPYDDRILEAQAARSPMLVGLLRNSGWAVRRLGLPGVVSRVKSNSLVSKILFTSDAGSNPAAPKAQTLEDLQNRFGPDQALLANILVSKGTG